jgi:hypothetical protein
LKALERDSKTPFQIAREIFPRLPRENLFRMISDVMGQLEMLKDGGIVAGGEGESLVFRRVIPA